MSASPLDWNQRRDQQFVHFYSGRGCARIEQRAGHHANIELGDQSFAAQYYGHEPASASDVTPLQAPYCVEFVSDCLDHE